MKSKICVTKKPPILLLTKTGWRPIIKTVRQPIDGLPSVMVKEITALWGRGGYFFFVIEITSEMIDTIRFNRRKIDSYVTVMFTALLSKRAKSCPRNLREKREQTAYRLRLP